MSITVSYRYKIRNINKLNVDLLTYLCQASINTGCLYDCETHILKKTLFLEVPIYKCDAAPIFVSTSQLSKRAALISMADV